MAGPEDTPSQNCWEFSQSEDSKKVTEEDIGSSVVGFVGVREEWIDGDCIIQWASLISHTPRTSLTHLPTLAQCHDFRRFPTFSCLSPKRPHSFTQPMTCFPFPFPHDLYLIFYPTFILSSYSVISDIKDKSSLFGYSETSILRSTEGVLSTGKPPALQTPLCTCG